MYVGLLKNLDCLVPFNLKSVRGLYRSNKIDFDTSVKLVSRWRDNVSYLCFKRQDLNSNLVDYVHLKASKRGNDVYRWRVYRRHKDILDFCDKYEDYVYIKDSESGFVSNVLKFTLTVQRDKFDIDFFNKKLVSVFYDRFVKRLKNHFGDCAVSRSFEVNENGLLHVNVVVVFHDQLFPVYRHTSRIDNKVTWRLRDKSLKDFICGVWDPVNNSVVGGFYDGGFVDVRSVLDNHDLLEYVLKYHIKYFTNYDCKRKQELTLSVLSLFNKRSISIPDRFKSYVFSCVNSDPCVRLDKYMHNSLKVEYAYSFMGIINDFELDFCVEDWFFVTKDPPGRLDPGGFDSLDGLDLFFDRVTLNFEDSGARFFIPGNEIKRKFTRQKKFVKGGFDKFGRRVK